MKSMNKMQLIGRLGADPIVRYSGDGNPITNISIATTDQWTDRNSGERKEATEWHRAVAFGKLAEIVRDYTSKGDSVFVEGKVKTSKYQDKEGVNRESRDVVISDVILLGGSRQQGQGGQAPASNPQPAASNPQPDTTKDDFFDDGGVDDIQF